MPPGGRSPAGGLQAGQADAGLVQAEHASGATRPVGDGGTGGALADLVGSGDCRAGGAGEDGLGDGEVGVGVEDGEDDPMGSCVRGG
jgi:hypothetical protein